MASSVMAKDFLPKYKKFLNNFNEANEVKMENNKATGRKKIYSHLYTFISVKKQYNRQI